MKESEEKKELINAEVPALAGVKTFSHVAMATTFKILLIHDDQTYSRQVCSAVFREVDRLEGQLSKFLESSDIARINNLSPGKSRFVSIETFECLKIAERIFNDTNGAFDVTYGSLDTEEDESSDTQEKIFPLKLNDDNYTIETLQEGVRVDLGGIGKGYAADVMAGKLREFHIDNALVSAGFSSIMSMDEPEQTKGWPAAFRNPYNRRQVLAKGFLKNIAIGSSGILKGGHIINPDTGVAVETRLAAWSVASDAATADALSTAFMIMEPEEIELYCQEHPDTGALILLDAQDDHHESKILRFGRQDYFLKPQEK